MNQVFWIEANPPVKLAVVLCPRGDGDLKTQLLDLKQAGIETVVSLLVGIEAEWLGLARESQLAAKAGLGFLSYPIPDTRVPSDTSGFRNFVAEVADRLLAGEAIGVHCRGSIGRSTVTAACALIHLGWEPAAALAAIQAARGRPVPDTEEQRRWIMAYKAKP